LKRDPAAARRFTLVELMIVVAIVAVLAAIAIPSLYTMQLKAKRAELPLNADGLSTAIAAYHAAQDNYYPGCTTSFCIESAPSGAAGKSRRPWGGTSAVNVTTNLGWTPDGDVYGSYVLVRANDGVAYSQYGCTCHMNVGDPATVCVMAHSDLDATGSSSHAQYTTDHTQKVKPTWCATGPEASTY
jgi:prepilin-type N-terminal cleavage/methylation domain-containing protein